MLCICLSGIFIENIVFFFSFLFCLWFSWQFNRHTKVCYLKFIKLSKKLLNIFLWHFVMVSQIITYLRKSIFVVHSFCYKIKSISHKTLKKLPSFFKSISEYGHSVDTKRYSFVSARYKCYKLFEQILKLYVFILFLSLYFNYKQVFDFNNIIIVIIKTR